MNMSMYLVAAGFTAIYMLVAWITVDMLHLGPRVEPLVRMVLLGFGAGLYGGLVYFLRGRKERKAAAAAQAAAAAGVPVSGVAEIQFLIRDAEARLSSSLLGKDAKLGTLPAIFILGEPATAKTSTMLHSGTEPELLAGQLYQAGGVVPTRANFWFARRTVFIEAGGKLLPDAERWMTLVRGLRYARKLRMLFSRRPHPARAALVCVDCEGFLKRGAQEKMAQTARSLHARLSEISQTLGINLPVYVLFTRMDRVPFFFEYVRNVTEDETTQVCGATLPIVVGNRSGVYGEEEARRVTDAFTELLYSLCDKRTVFLAREHHAHHLPPIYEFPREFRKLRTALVQFLVDLGRPSQLRASHFVRGFYFSGVRPVEVHEAVAAVRTAQRQAIEAAQEATDMFGTAAAEEGPAERRVEAPPAGVRRVPQWVFLNHLFNDVILSDRAALGTSARSTQLELRRRVLLIAAGALCLIAALGFTVSYFGNRRLETQVMDAARGISFVASSGQEVPSLDSLRRLESLRQSVELLTQYQREGAPWGLRWGLYVGNDLVTTVRGLYFGRFHQLLFGSTQAGLLDWLRRLPPAPGPNDEYAPTYDTLKAYLITTSHHDKSTVLFLSPFLLSRWTGKREIDADRMNLAKLQFDFYSKELKEANPYSSENDTQAIERGRRYLSQFNAVERIYQFMLAEASRKNKPVNFNRDVPGSAQVVINNREIAGAYSRDGWLFMQDAIKHAQKFYGGEEWVLGPQTAAALDPAKLEPELRARYHADYVAHWREYLRNSSIVRYASVDDAARKLTLLSNNRSFLLALFCVASVNVDVASTEAKSPFQPVQHVTPPACPDRYIGPSNSGYMSALVALQASMEQVARGGRGNEQQVNQTINDAANAKKVTRDVAQNFRIDKDGHVEAMVQKLMEDPITNAEALLGRLGPAQLNAAGRNFCNEFMPLINKYPFNTASKVDASLEEINGVFRPGDGSMWAFYDNNLKNSLVKQGNQYGNTGGNVRLTPAFVKFFNRAAAFSDALYKGGVKEPHLDYSLRALPAEGIQSLTLQLDGQTLKSTGSGGTAVQFRWPGTAQKQTRLAGSLGGPELGFLSYDGLWAVFRFFGDADKWQASGQGYEFEWVPRQGQSAQPMTLDNGHPLTVRYYLDMGTTEPIFRKGYLSNFQCVSQVAQ